MEAEQYSIFEFAKSDEVKEKLKELSLEKEIELPGYAVRITDHGYEIETEEQHIGFLNIEECYRKIHSQLLKEG